MWLPIGLGVVALVIAVAAYLILRSGHAPNVLTGLLWTFTSANAYARLFRHALVVASVILFFVAVKSHAVGVAERKAGDWLTSYNGVVTTTAVGPIKAEPGPPLAVISPTPSSAATTTSTPVEQAQVVQSQEQPSQSNATATVADAKPSGAATPKPTPTPSAVEQKRLDAQLRTIRDRIKHHGEVMAFFYVNYFVAIVMVMVAGLIVAVTLFMIAQKGWTGTSSYVEAIFIVASMWVAFYGLFPPVFQQEQNITDNKALFLKFKGLETEVESYPVTLLTLKNESKTPREFINHIDFELDRLGNIALGFDVNKISYQDAITLSKEKPNSSANANSSPPPTRTRGVND